MKCVTTRSYSRFIILVLLAFQAVSLALILGWLYVSLARSYAQEFQRELDVVTAQGRLRLQERVSHAVERLHACSGDNALRVALMLGVRQQVEEQLARYRHPQDGVEILIRDSQTGRIYGVPPASATGTPLVDKDRIRSFFAFGPRVFPYFYGDQCLFVATSAIYRKNEMLGTALLLYAPRNDQAFNRANRPDRWIGYRRGSEFLDLFSARSLKGRFVERDGIPGLIRLRCPQDGGCYVTNRMGDYDGLSVALPLDPLLEQRAHLWHTFGLLYMVVIAATCLVGLAIYRRIDRPLKALVRHTEQLAQTPSPHFIDQQALAFVEFKAFAASFNKMLASFLDLQRRLASRARERLEESEARYRTLVETSPLGIVTIDATGCFRFANPAALRILGCRPEEVKDLSWNQLQPSEPLPELFVRAADSTEGPPVEARLRRKDGRPAWVEVLARGTREGEEELMMLTLVDITDKKSAEEERQRLITAVEQVPEAIVITDRNRDILYANRAFKVLFGYDRRQSVGCNLRSLLATPGSQTVHAQMQEALERGETWVGTVTNRTALNEELEMETSVTPVLGEDGRLRHIVYVKRDVTQERRMERQLRQTQKLQAIGTLAGGIAHDFNNVLAGILGNAQLAMRMVEGNDQVHHRLERICQACRRASEMVRQILAFSRSKEKPFHTVPLRSVLEEALQLLRASLPAMIRIETHLEAEDDVVLGDATQLHQVIMNLGTNAAHAMKERHGVLEVRLQEKVVSSRRQAEALGIAPGAYLCLTLRDTGTGIPPHIVDRIFEPFFTTKAAGEGTGLGLSVVHGIVRSHGGGIEVESRVGEGTTFRVYLPKSAEMRARKERESAPFRQVSPKEILVVDDEEMIREMTTEFLGGDGHRVTAIASPMEVLERVADGGRSFDLLIFDQTMPEMTGLELLEKVRKQGLQAPAVLCSGDVRRVSPELRKALGIHRVLQKPFSLEELNLVLAEIFDGRSSDLEGADPKGLRTD